MIAVIAAIAEGKKVQRSYGNHSPAIVATTIFGIELFPCQRSSSLRSLRSLESGFHMIAAIVELFFLSDRSDHSDDMETRLKRQVNEKKLGHVAQIRVSHFT